MPRNDTTKEKELEIINSLNVEEKPKRKSKPKPKIKPILQPISNPAPIKEIDFEPIIFVSKTTYKLNQIGIRRKIQQIGKFKTKILNTEVIEVKVISSLFKKINLSLNKLWIQYLDYWNKRFNKPYEVIEDEKPLLEIFESDK